MIRVGLCRGKPRWQFQATAIRRSKHFRVGRRAEDFGAADSLALGFGDLSAKPARDVDLGGRGQARLDGRPAIDHEVVPGFPECETERFAGPFGNRLAEVVGGRLVEVGHHRARVGVAHPGVGDKVPKRVNPIDDKSHALESFRGARNALARCTDSKPTTIRLDRRRHGDSTLPFGGGRRLGIPGTSAPPPWSGTGGSFRVSKSDRSTTTNARGPWRAGSRWRPRHQRSCTDRPASRQH